MLGQLGWRWHKLFSALDHRFTIVQRSGRILASEDQDAAEVLHSTLASEGVRFLTNANVKAVEHTVGITECSEIRLSVECEASIKTEEVLICDALLVAIGRSPNVENLGLEAAGVEYEVGVGVHVGDDLATTNPAIFAIGDVIGRGDLRFTHMAGTMAGMAVQNALFSDGGLPVNASSGKLSDLVVPRVTYTEPEIASCGKATLQSADMDTYTAMLDDNDRHLLEGACPGGFVRIHCRRGTDEILSATIVAERAGDMLAELTLAMQHGLGLAAVARTIHPYPTMGEAVQQCALQYNRKHWSRLPPHTDTA